MTSLLNNLSIHTQMQNSQFTTAECVEKIIDLNERLAKFWSAAQGWAPRGAAELMSKSRLDRQASLSHSLKRWVESGTLSDGDLILAWTNIGALIEGTMKLFLAVYYEDYKKDIHSFKEKSGNLIEPDSLMLEKLKQFFKKRALFLDWQDLIQVVQSRRNAIHAFQDKNIGTHSQFLQSVKEYWYFLTDIDNSLPYPDASYP